VIPEDSGAFRKKQTYIRPLDFGGIFEVSFKVYRDAWKQLLLIPAAAGLIFISVLLVAGLAFIAPVTAYFDGFTSEGWNPDVLPAVVITVVIVFIAVAIAVGGLINATVTQVAANAYLGRKVSMGAALKAGFFAGLPVVIIQLVTGLIAGVGLLFFVLPGVMLWTMWSAAVPVAVVEKKGPFASMRRSWELMQGRMWRSVGVYTAVWVLVVAIVGSLRSSTMGAQQFTFDAEALTAVPQLEPWQIGLDILLSMVGSWITYPVLLIFSTVIYFNQRVEKEAFDQQIQVPPAEPGPLGADS
jgi:hypothetical protein